MRGMKALVAAVIVMGIAIVLGTGVLVATVVHRAMHPARSMPSFSPATAAAALRLDEPAGTCIVSVVRLSDTTLALTLSGGGGPDRLVVWDLTAGRLIAAARLER